MVTPGNFRTYTPVKMPWVMETLPQMRPYLMEESHVNTDSDNIR